MEYCPHGNLRNFLRSSREFYDIDEETLIPDSYQLFGPKCLMYFAWQIANGLTFLTSRKVCITGELNKALTHNKSYLYIQLSISFRISFQFNYR